MNTTFKNIRLIKFRFLSLAVVGLCLTCARSSTAQQLESIGLNTSWLTTHTPSSQAFVTVQSYDLYLQRDRSNLNNVGYRVAAFARWQFMNKRWFGQTELAYSSTEGSRVDIGYHSKRRPIPGMYNFMQGYQPDIRRLELATLLGFRTTHHLYLLAGPMVALNRRDQVNYTWSSVDDQEMTVDPALIQALYNGVNRVQLLGQVGAGVCLGRFDFNLRYEYSLTRFISEFRYQGTTYRYQQHTSQFLATAGFAIYRPKPAAAP